MKERRTLLIALGLVCLVVIVTAFLYDTERRRQRAVREEAEQVLDAESSALEARSSGDLEITLYFYRPSVGLDLLDTPPLQESNGITIENITIPAEPPFPDALAAVENSGESEVWISETRSVFRTDDIILTARQIIHEVMKGPSQEEFRIFAPEARVRQVFLLEDGTALVDLPRRIVHPLLGGVAVELSALYSITRSLKENIKDIRQTRFLVEGQERPTLAGHVSITEPFM
ncbi:MAG: GerMN domain-containing protein [Acidobacteriota bacterium]